MNILETDRLTHRGLTLDDADFIIELLNDPDFLRYIGDRGVRTTEDAHKYILDGPVASHERYGFGLDLVSLKSSGAPIGICGLLKRDNLDHPDIGFAFLPQFRSQGYGSESAAAALAHGRETHGLGRIVAITSPRNEGSIRLLEKIGFKYEGLIKMAEDDEVKFFASEP